MKIFIDSADIQEIKALHDLGLVDGVTTNPSLIAKSGRNILDVTAEIAALISGPVSAEVTATDAQGMIQEGHKLSKIADNVIVKVPLTPEGLIACRTLTDQGIGVNVTLCFSANQALLAAKAGAMFISPFIGRLDDIGQDGMQLIEDICDMYRNYPQFTTEVLVASVRHPVHVTQSALMGADAITLPPKIVHQMFKHPLTDSGLEAFLSDWSKTGQSIL